MVTLPETFTEHIAPVTEVQPDHEPKVLVPAVAGAPKIIVVPELSVSVNGVIPVVRRLVTEFP